MMRRALTFILGIALVALTSCQREAKSVGTTEGEVKIARYDRLQFEYVTLNSLSALQKMSTDYPQATKLLIEDVLAIGQVEEDHIEDRLLEYFQDTTLLALVRDAEKKFAELDWVEDDLTQAFKRLKKDLPSLPIPRVYAQISALNQSVVVTDSLLGFSLDKYMGADYPIYKRFYYDYQSRSMEPDRIVPDCLTFYLVSQYPLPWQPGRMLLDMILHRGKINWVVARVLDYDSPEDAMGYDDEEKAWCKKNAKLLWRTMTENRHLYATDPMVVRTYLRQNPYVPIMGGHMPASVGVWIGMRIIDAYMEKHPEVTVGELLRDNDYERILAESDFNL